MREGAGIQGSFFFSDVADLKAEEKFHDQKSNLVLSMGCFILADQYNS